MPNIITAQTVIPDTFGSGGANIPPVGSGTPSARDLLRELQVSILALDSAIGADSAANLASTTTGKGASLVGIEDAGGIITATTVEGALAEIKAEADAAIALQKRTVAITEATLTQAGAGTAQAVNVGAALPANAIILAAEVNITTLFSGGGATAVKMDLGGTTTTAIVNQLDVFTGAATGALSPRTGAHAQGKFSSEQLVATFTPDGGHNLNALTAGSLTITVWFSVLA